MTAHVRIDGEWVDTMFPVADVQHSTIWRVDDPSGCYQASVVVAAPENYDAPWTLRGRRFEVFSPAGGLIWGGMTTEPDRDDDGLTIHAIGFGGTLEDFPALVFDEITGLFHPTFIPNEAVDTAVEHFGVMFDRYGVDLGSAAEVPTEEGVNVLTVGKLLALAATRQGKRVHVDATGAITYRADPTSPLWTTLPDPYYMGTADDQFVTRLWGYFVNIADPSVDDTDMVFAEDTDAEWAFGPRHRTIDLSNLGGMATADAQSYIDGRFALVGGRMGWTNSIDLGPLNLMDIDGTAVPARNVQAGDMIQIPDNRDARSTPTVRAAIRFVISEVRVTEGHRPTATAAPVGFTPRDFEGALAPPEKPAEAEEAA